MRKTSAARAAATAAVLTLALTACTEDDPQSAPSAPSSEASAPDDGAESGSAGGGSSTAGGGTAGTGESAADEGFDDALGLNEAATATHKDDDGDTKLSIKPEKAVKGSWADFKGFDLKSVETKGKVPYYVTMSYTSKGGAEPWIPSWDGEVDAMTGPDRPAQSVNMVDDFPKCPGVDESVPSGEFKVGTTDRPCNVYVVPEGEPLYVRWGADAEGQQAPLVWKVAG